MKHLRFITASALLALLCTALPTMAVENISIHMTPDGSILPDAQNPNSFGSTPPGSTNGSIPAPSNDARICGKSAALPNGAGYVGLLVKMQPPGVFVPKDACSKTNKLNVNTAFKDNPTVAPYLASLKWNTSNNAACETVGKNFTSANHTNPDICVYMPDYYYSYSVVKDASKNTTSYVKGAKMD